MKLLDARKFLESRAGRTYGLFYLGNIVKVGGRYTYMSEKTVRNFFHKNMFVDGKSRKYSDSILDALIESGEVEIREVR